MNFCVYPSFPFGFEGGMGMRDVGCDCINS